MGHSWTGEISNFDTKLLQGRPGNLDHLYFETIILTICLFIKGAILVYDVTSRESFQKIDNWLNELETYSTNHDLIKMLVGNKVRSLKQISSN